MATMAKTTNTYELVAKVQLATKPMKIQTQKSSNKMAQQVSQKSPPSGSAAEPLFVSQGLSRRLAATPISMKEGG